MTLPPEQADALAREGIDALRRGDGTAARAALDRFLIAVPDGPRPWLPLAQACRLVGDAAAETRALEALLASDPRNLPALLLMGNRKHDDGDDRAAVSFYTAALNQAAASEPPIPSVLEPLLARAQTVKAGAAERFEAHLLATVDKDAPPRVRHAIDVLLGRTPLYQQEPSSFYFPGLAQRAFFDRSEFAWAANLEAQSAAIRAEVQAVMADDTGFEPYVGTAAGRPRPNNPLLDDPSWGAFHLWKGGAIVAANADRCPATMAALARLPIPRIAGRSPMALFSRLRPGTHIRPHHGMLNTRLICHLPLVVPSDCALRVGSETRPWREGELTIFDDSFEHEAWNRSDTTRTVLLFEIWRPDIVEAERPALTHLFESIDAYSGVAPDDH